MIKSTDLIVKSNSLVEARYKLSIWESRIFAKMVTMIEKDDKEFATYEIDIRELMRFFETKAHNDFERIKEVPELLLKKTIKIPIIDKGKQAFLVTNMISSAIVPRGEEIHKESVLKLSFDPKLKPYLLELKKRFLQYDIKNVLRISSPHSIRIYELLKQFESTGWRQISLKEFKEILGLEDKYKKYNHLKSRVLKQAEKDLEKYTDICFTFEEIKRGRKIYALKFYIYKNTTGQKKKQEPKEEKAFEIYNEPSETLKALIKVGIDPKKAQSLINTYGENVVAQELKYAQKELKSVTNVKSTTGFIISKIEQQSYTKKQAILQAEKEQKQRKQEAKKKQQQLHKLKIEELRAEYQIELGNAVGEMIKDLDKKQINMAIMEYGGNNIFIKRAIERAEEQGNQKEAKELRESVLAKGLKDEKLQSFDKYLEMVHQHKLGRDGEGEQVLQSLK